MIDLRLKISNTTSPLGTEIVKKLSYDICRSLVGSPGYISNEICVPDIKYDESENCWIQQIIIGNSNSDDCEIDAELTTMNIGNNAR